MRRHSTGQTQAAVATAGSWRPSARELARGARTRSSPVAVRSSQWALTPLRSLAPRIDSALSVHQHNQHSHARTYAHCIDSRSTCRRPHERRACARRPLPPPLLLSTSTSCRMSAPSRSSRESVGEDSEGKQCSGRMWGVGRTVTAGECDRSTVSAARRH